MAALSPAPFHTTPGTLLLFLLATALAIWGDRLPFVNQAVERFMTFAIGLIILPRHMGIGGHAHGTSGAIPWQFAPCWHVAIVRYRQAQINRSQKPPCPMPR